MSKTAQQRKNKPVLFSIAAQFPLSFHSNENPYNWGRRKDRGMGWDQVLGGRDGAGVHEMHIGLRPYCPLAICKEKGLAWRAYFQQRDRGTKKEGRKDILHGEKDMCMCLCEEIRNTLLKPNAPLTELVGINLAKCGYRVDAEHA